MFPDPTLDECSQLFCFHTIIHGTDMVTMFKEMVEEAASNGYRMVRVDNGEDLGLDSEGQSFANKRGNRCRIHFKKF